MIFNEHLVSDDRMKCIRHDCSFSFALSPCSKVTPVLVFVICNSARMYRTANLKKYRTYKW